MPVKSEPNWPRWLEGWGLVFPSVGLALLAAWLALPQGTMPNYLPLPLVSPAELAAASADQQLEARQARHRPFDCQVRGHDRGARRRKGGPDKD